MVGNRYKIKVPLSFARVGRPEGPICFIHLLASHSTTIASNLDILGQIVYSKKFNLTEPTEMNMYGEAIVKFCRPVYYSIHSEARIQFFTRASDHFPAVL